MAVIIKWVNTVSEEVLATLTQQEKCRQEVIHELILTEEFYSRDISLIIEVYLKPLRIMKLLSEENIQLVFHNIEEIYDVSRNFLIDLKRRQSEHQPTIQYIGDIFENHLHLYQAYKTFCEGQIVAAQTIGQLYQENGQFYDFIQQAKNDPRYPTQLDLNAQLLKPMQRITKYPLLIKSILTFTNSEHEDYHRLKKILVCVEKEVWSINEHIRKKEATKRRWKIEESLEYVFVNNKPALQLPVNDEREYAHEGTLSVVPMAKSSGHEVYAFLFSDYLILTKAKKEDSEKYVVYMSFSLAEMSVYDDSPPIMNPNTGQNDEGLSFKLIYAGWYYPIHVTSVKDKRIWLLKFERLKVSKVVGSLSKALQICDEKEFQQMDQEYHSEKMKKQNWRSIFGHLQYKAVKSRPMPAMTPSASVNGLSSRQDSRSNENEDVCPQTPQLASLPRNALQSSFLTPKFEMEKNGKNDESLGNVFIPITPGAVYSMIAPSPSATPRTKLNFFKRLRKFSSSPSLLKEEHESTVAEKKPQENENSVETMSITPLESSTSIFTSPPNNTNRMSLELNCAAITAPPNGSDLKDKDDAAKRRRLSFRRKTKSKDEEVLLSDFVVEFDQMRVEFIKLQTIIQLLESKIDRLESELEQAYNERKVIFELAKQELAQNIEQIVMNVLEKQIKFLHSDSNGIKETEHMLEKLKIGKSPIEDAKRTVSQSSGDKVSGGSTRKRALSKFARVFSSEKKGSKNTVNIDNIPVVNNLHSIDNRLPSNTKKTPSMNDGPKILSLESDDEFFDLEISSPNSQIRNTLTKTIYNLGHDSRKPIALTNGQSTVSPLTKNKSSSNPMPLSELNISMLKNESPLNGRPIRKFSGPDQIQNWISSPLSAMRT